MQFPFLVQTRVCPESEAMNWPPTVKSLLRRNSELTLCDYARTCAEFPWDRAHHELDGLPNGRGLNIAHEAVYRHANGPPFDAKADRPLKPSLVRR